ncbi:AAA family ATPase, partial [Cellulomonas sp. NPDC057328]|uniref:AAA family ATPase n=1 Tax=Cellulomonas sp. NPDC057328 TaxID=3346101 RepID=UPI00363581AD
MSGTWVAPADGTLGTSTSTSTSTGTGTGTGTSTGTGTGVPADGSARVPWRAGPLLGAFARVGVLTGADVHVAERLGVLTGEDDERVHLAAALAVRAVRTGSVCVTLADAPGTVDVADPDDVHAWTVGAPVGTYGGGTSGGGTARATPDLLDTVAALPWPDLRAWTDAVRRSPMVADGPTGPADRPVRWVDGRVYLDRHWRDEQLVRHEVDARLATPLPADDDAVRRAVAARFPRAGDDRQRVAAATAAVSRLTVLTGGPGTGKTTTVARLVAVLRDVHGADLRVALAAPTGKAAARLQEAVDAELTALAAGSGGAAPPPLHASTLHRLLGSRPGGGTRFRHDRTHRLPHDVVVVDEASMVSLPLLARLLEALRPDARLVLVGDPDQLASVEVGAVLGDLVAREPAADALPARLRAVLPALAAAEDRDAIAPRAGVVRLTVPHRFGTQLGALADAVRAGRADDVVTLLRAGGEHVAFVETAAEAPSADELADVRADEAATGLARAAAARAGDAAGAREALG